VSSAEQVTCRRISWLLIQLRRAWKKDVFIINNALLSIDNQQMMLLNALSI